MTRPWFYGPKPSENAVAAPVPPRTVRTAAIAQPEPPLVMVPHKPCPCEAMEALLKSMGEPESEDWLQHFEQEDRQVIPALRQLGFTEAANQIVSDHGTMRKQIRSGGHPDYDLLSRHAAFEDELIKRLGHRIMELRAEHNHGHLRVKP